MRESASDHVLFTNITESDDNINNTKSKGFLEKNRIAIKTSFYFMYKDRADMNAKESPKPQF